MGSKSGVCRLCGNQSTFVDSHIIPRSFHDRDAVTGEKARILTNAADKHPKRSPIGIYSQFLCLDCERRFGPWDNYATKYLLEAGPLVSPLKNQDETVALRYPACDYSALKLFFLSVLWRAHCSDHHFFKRVHLGSRADDLREHIRASNPGGEDEFAVVLAIFDHPVGAVQLDPHVERYDGIRVYRIYLGGYVAYVKTVRRPFSPTLRSCQLNSSASPIVIMRKFSSSRELVIVQNIVRRNRTSS